MEKKNYIYNAIVTNVVDGDTIDVEIDLGFSIKLKQRLRLYGVNTKELHSKDNNDRAEALSAKNYLETEIANKSVTLETFKDDKYGRMLANVFINDVCINNQLLKENLAIEYFGKNS